MYQGNIVYQSLFDYWIFKLLNIDVQIFYALFNLLKVHNMELSLCRGEWGEREWKIIIFIEWDCSSE